MPEEKPNCGDCGVKPGMQHWGGCDVARCLWTGMQRLACKWFGLDPLLTEHDCGADVWTGEWPGDKECREFGWYSYWDGPNPTRGWDYRGRGWVRVEADHPDAQPDLNRLVTEAHWNRREQRWEKDQWTSRSS
jgi:hypothetical protein